MRFFITGGTGFLGTALTGQLLGQGHAVTILTRRATARQHFSPALSYLVGNPNRPGEWQEEMARHDVVINLAGASIFRRWNEKSKKILRESRLRTTANIVAGLSAQKGETRALISGSAVGYYGFRSDEVIDENGGNGDDFLATLTREWETAACEAEEYGIRVALCRFGVILSHDGGAMSKMLNAFKWGMGSPLGSGRQWFSWIHLDDVANALLFLAKTEAVSGPVNCTAPEPVTNRELSRTLGRVLHRPVLPAIPALLVRLILGEFGSVILEGQRVVPKKLLDHGFSFRYPAIRAACEAVARRAGA